jgi:hypothetical protein
VVSVPTDTGQRREVGPPVERPPAVSVGGSGAWPPRERRERHRPEPPAPRPAESEPADRPDRPAMRRRRGTKG